MLVAIDIEMEFWKSIFQSSWRARPAIFPLMHNYEEVVSMITGQARKDEGGEWLYHLYLLNRPKLFNKLIMNNADITK